MNIVICAGGTGSIALQTGLHAFLQRHGIFEGVNVKILVNAYDNGLSTSSVRQVMGGQILGPSDVRKNQTTQLKLRYPGSPWLTFLDKRFTVETHLAEEWCQDRVTELAAALGRESDDRRILAVRGAISGYFKMPAATQIDYSDFSLANIVYAGFAKASGMSLRRAASIMAGLLDIPDNVIVNDDTSLFLGAVTQSGRRIADEGDIVSWGNVSDPFVDIFFYAPSGEPVGGPVLCDEAADALREADLIILSTGTQWSSLIPTYASRGFTDAIDVSSARVVMVMNRIPDKDSPGQSASDIINILVPRYFSPSRISVVLDSSGHEIMNTLSDGAEALILRSGKYALADAAGAKTSDPHALIRAVLHSAWLPELQSDHFMFDYDDTLVARGARLPGIAATNRRLLCSLAARSDGQRVSICSGNSIRAINLSSGLTESEIAEGTLVQVFADGGVNHYTVRPTVSRVDTEDPLTIPVYNGCLFKKGGLSALEIDRIISTLVNSGIARSKIESRGGVMVCVKPIEAEWRRAIASLISLLLNTRLGDMGLEAKITGRTTIEIARTGLSKMTAVKHMMQQHDTITFLGDEFNGGNDEAVRKSGIADIKFLEISSTAKTAMFLSTLVEMYVV